MSHKNKIPLVKQLLDVLDSKHVQGRSKYKDKKDGVDCRKYIYSWGTYKTYFKQGKLYFNWLKKKGYRCKKLIDCRAYCDEYLQEAIDRQLSPFTIKLYVATFSKIFGDDSSTYIDTPPRLRKNVFRSRKSAIRDKNYNPETISLVEAFAKSVGLRKSELKALRGNRLRYYPETGEYKVLVNSASKGGRPREALVIGDVKLVVSLMEAAGDNKVFANVPDIDIHHLRAVYASNLYTHLTKTQGIPKDPRDRYIHRRELAGKVLSKSIMRQVSENLGHSRINVMAQSYSYLIHAEVEK